MACGSRTGELARPSGLAERLRRGPPGDRVGLFAENGPFFVAAYLGAIRAGLCAVPFPVDCSETPSSGSSPRRA